MRQPLPSLAFFLLLAAIAQVSSPSEQSDKPAQSGKPTVPTSELGRWERFRSPVLSPTGDALAYVSQRVDGKSELRIRRLQPDETWVIPWGTGAVFSEQGRWIAWRVTPSKEEREKLEKEKKPIRHRGEVMELATGERRDLGEISKLELDPSGFFLAVHGIVDPEREPKVSDVHVIDLERGKTTIFGNAESASWHEELPLLAMIVHGGGGRGNAVQVYAAKTGRVQGLDHSPSTYRHLAWREHAADLAVLRAKEPATEEEDEEASAKDSDDKSAADVDTTEFELLAWTGLADDDGAAASEPRIFGETAAGFEADFHVTGDTEPSWSPDSLRLSLGLRRREPDEDGKDADGEDADTKDEATKDTVADVSDESSKEDASDPPETKTEDLAGVQIWHSSDVRIIPRQQAEKEEDRQRAFLAVWDLEADRVVRVGTDLEHESEVLASWSHAIETDESPYPWGNMFGRPYHDIWTADLATGERRKSLEKVRHSWPSTGGRYLLVFDGQHFVALELSTGQRRNLTEGLPTRFADSDRDLPNDGLEPPFGIGGWTEDDKGVLLYDEFDVWRVAPDGSSSVRLTRGAEDQTVHRMEIVKLTEAMNRFGFGEKEAFVESEGLYFSLRGEWTEQRGFARWTVEEGYRRLALEDKSFWDLQKAESADALLYRRESRTDAPGLYVTDGSFDSPRLVAESNPFLSEYAWTRAELVEYRNGEDRRMHGVLLYPAGHDASRKYPMIVYGYEILSPLLHIWQSPDEKNSYNFTTWTQQGYFVLLPDVRFRAGDPGVSLAETLAAAIDKVDGLGLIDRSKVGFAGHSWGGYHATYLAARTHLFAATVAGAPLTDFVSFMGQIHWRPGLPESSHWETGQARMAVPYWEDPQGHHRNSPLHGAHEMTTPILMAHGNEDGVVEFFQSTVFYNFARRAGKQMVLLVYEGEGHGNRRDANRIDYHRRILEWFGHYLKGEPAPEWITKGVPWLDHEEEKRRLAPEPPVATEEAKAGESASANQSM